ncbi:MAG: PQQ-dependent sugar dehydrogenase, partial [Pseudomonadota bacterium]
WGCHRTVYLRSGIGRDLQNLSAALATRELRVVDPAEPGVTQFSLLKELDVRIRDVAMGPDGNIYVLTEGAGGGQVLKITPNA